MSDTPFSRSLDRQQKALDKLLEGVDSVYAQNDIRAHNETAWEIGAFSDETFAKHPLDRDDPLSEETRQGLLVRARRDALAAKLNAATLGDELSRISAKVDHLSVVGTITAGAVIAIAIKQWFG